MLKGGLSGQLYQHFPIKLMKSRYSVKISLYVFSSSTWVPINRFHVKYKVCKYIFADFVKATQ